MPKEKRPEHYKFNGPRDKGRFTTNKKPAGDVPHPLSGRKRQFIKNFVENGGDAIKAAKDAKFKAIYAEKYADKLLEDPDIHREISAALSKDGLKDRIREFYLTILNSQRATSVPKLTPTALQNINKSILDIMKSDAADSVKELAITAIRDQIAPSPNFQTRLWGADMGFRLVGEYAPSKGEMHHTGDVFAGKTDEEKEALIREAEEVARKASK